MTTAEYNRCVDEFSDRVFRFVLKNIQDEEKAKDVVQDSFEKMWVKVKGISFEKSKSYLFTTAYHTMIDYIRKDRKFEKINEPEKYGDLLYEENSYSDLKEILNEGLKQLSEMQRSVLLLRDYEGYSYKEIGDVTDLNESQVKVYIYRARVFLKNYIGSMETVI
ncbi:MAG: RNA polymerase sigma factor [Bacteroidales bacterium]|nr:RNA polymerase sigma factor [Bacteroidales bacterium]